MKKFLLTLAAAVLSLCSLHAQDTAEDPAPIYTLVFNSTTMQKGVSGYTDVSFNTICDGNSWTLVNFNNNNFQNNWDFVKCGSKNGAYTGYITTDFSSEIPIGKVVITLDKITNANYISLSTCETPDGEYTEQDKVTTGFVAGDLALEITTPTPDLYYRITVDCSKATSNGPVQISKVTYYADDNDNKVSPNLSYPKSAVSVVMEGTYTLPKLSNPDNVPITYSSSDESVATVDEEGNVTILDRGTTRITASTEGTENFYPAAVYYDLTVTLIAYEQTSYIIDLGDEFDTPALINPHGYTVTYTSSDEKVAKVDSTTGEVTVIGRGETTIVAKVTDSEATASYTLTVFNPNTAELKMTDLGIDTNGTVVDTYTFGTSAYSEAVTIKFDLGENTDGHAPSYYAPDVRMYAYNTLTISLQPGFEMDNVEFSTEGGKYQIKEGYLDATGSDPDDHGSFEDNVWYPCGEHTVTELVVTNTDTDQIRMIALAVAFHILTPETPGLILNGEEVAIDGTTFESEKDATIAFPEIAGLSYYYKWDDNAAVATADALEGYTKYSEPLTISKNGSLSFYSEYDTTGKRSEVRTIALDTNTAVSAIAADDAAATYYDLNGRKVFGQPAAGLYIVRKGDKAYKVIVK